MVLYDYFPTVVGNLRNSRKSWAWLSIILGQEGVKPQVSGVFFKSVVQTVLLFGSETWVITPPHGPGPGGGSAQVGHTYYR